jgi:hypothetical protein
VIDPAPQLHDHFVPVFAASPNDPIAKPRQQTTTLGPQERIRQAKLLIQSGDVQVNGAVETRTRRKLVIGDVVEVGGITYSP